MVLRALHRISIFLFQTFSQPSKLSQPSYLSLQPPQIPFHLPFSSTPLIFLSLAAIRILLHQPFRSFSHPRSLFLCQNPNCLFSLSNSLSLSRHTLTRFFSSLDAPLLWFLCSYPSRHPQPSSRMTASFFLYVNSHP